MNSIANKRKKCFTLKRKNMSPSKRILLLTLLSMLCSLIVMLIYGFDPINLDNWPHPPVSHHSQSAFHDITSLLDTFPKTITPPKFFSIFYSKPLGVDGIGETIAIIEFRVTHIFSHIMVALDICHDLLLQGS